ncbi:AAC-rich mRNA clone AAC11 protein-like [Diaphorina citri]|uniref:AAC-rich mRNA clone AAC11 protein-like n=1 Tax=Diaphorina citri TaxID=121845 RepID=A0A1S3DDR4_DIACI|nr:AAC-rich mRNA clone AAC11 protein-like [Diaphorina citri]
MQDFIKVKHTASSECDLQPYLDPNVTYSFTMCNPPFFSSVEDLVGNNATSGNSNFINETKSSNIINENKFMNGNSNCVNETNSSNTINGNSNTMNESNSNVNIGQENY